MRATIARLDTGVHVGNMNAYLGEFRNVWVDGSGDIYIPVGNSSSTNGTVDVVHAHDWNILVRRRPISVNRRNNSEQFPF